MYDYSDYYDYYDYSSTPAFNPLPTIISLVLCVFVLVCMWIIFRKAGKPGWAAIVPFYNLYVLFDITWGSGMRFLLMLIPLYNIILGIQTQIRLAKAFGKGGGFAAGLIFLPYVFMPLLAFGKGTYQGVPIKAAPYQNNPYQNNPYQSNHYQQGGYSQQPHQPYQNPYSQQSQYNAPQQGYQQPQQPQYNAAPQQGYQQPQQPQYAAAPQQPQQPQQYTAPQQPQQPAAPQQPQQPAPQQPIPQQPEAETRASTFCPSCGAKSNGEKFCQNCGAPLR